MGAATGYEAGAWVAAHHGWRMSFIASAVPGVLVALLILFFMREPQRTGAVEKTKTDKASVMSLAKNKAYLCSILGYAAVTFSLGGISWWMPSFLHREAGYSIEAAGAVMGPIIVVAGLGGTALGGWLAQWWSKKTPKALYLVPALSAALTIAPAVVCFFGPQGMDRAVAGRGGVPHLPRHRAGECGDAECGAGAPARDGHGGTVVCDSRVRRYAVVEGDRDDQRRTRTCGLGMAATLVAFAVGAVIFFVGARFAPPLTDGVEAPAPA